jgi:flagellar basal-body rod modification protein FlgD
MTEVAAANSYGAYGSQSGSSTGAKKNSELGTDTFLQLLVTQMRYQDPFSGGQDMGEFMNQVAQFTMLERVIKLQQTLEDYVASQAPVKALTLLNKTVEVLDENGEIQRGEASKVRFEGGTPLIRVNDKEYFLQDIISVEVSGDPVE